MPPSNEPISSHPPTARATIDSPLGTLTLLAGGAGLRAVLWPDDRRLPRRDTVDDAVDDTVDNMVDDATHPVLVAAAAQLGEYFAGTRTTFDVALDPEGTEFQRAAWCALRTIPYGCTASYGEQAELMGDRRKARAVGAANGRNPISIIVPCHRVVAANGALTGFAGGMDAKAWLLDHERRHTAGRAL